MIKAPSLEKLTFSGPFFTTRGVIALVEGSPKLNFIDLSCVPHISSSKVEEAAKKAGKKIIVFGSEAEGIYDVLSKFKENHPDKMKAFDALPENDKKSVYCNAVNEITSFPHRPLYHNRPAVSDKEKETYEKVELGKLAFQGSDKIPKEWHCDSNEQINALNFLLRRRTKKHEQEVN